MMVENYHKHTTWSNFFQIDSTTSLPDFTKKGDSLGCRCLFSGEHGYQGEWLHVYDLCLQDKFARDNNLSRLPLFRYSVEAYWVKDRTEKDNTNCHMVLVARTYNGIRKLNYILSKASDDGYYYKPRIDLDLLFTLDKEDVYVTSACLAGWKYDDADAVWLRIAEHFGDSFFLEYQAHHTQRQKELNRRIQELARNHGLQTIIGLDTHYISPEDAKKRDNLLKRKGIVYPEEEGWFMDWPSGSQLFQRMQSQGVLTDEEILLSMMNTHVFLNGCENISISTDFKIPILPQYQSLSYPDRVAELKSILNERYKTEDAPHRTEDRRQGLRYEVRQIEESGTADYFLTNHHIVKTATSPQYGGHLTTTSRGSAGSYYTSKLLGFTTIDRFEAEVPIYPERFITKERILSSHQMPDIDFNCESQEPFVKATKDLIGEHSCYPLLAVGKLKEKNAFKLYAGIHDVEPSYANEITTMIDRYNEAKKQADDEDKAHIHIEDFIEDKDMLAIYRESIDYQNIIEQAKVHACGFLIFNGNPEQKDVIGYGDIRYEIGLVRCVSESTGNSSLVACVEGSLLDAYGYCKNDYLIVDVVGIIYKLYHSIGMEVPTVSKLREMVTGDSLTWDLYAKGATCCLNQCEKYGTTQKVMVYKPQTVKELAAFIAAIRPGFKSLLDGFLRRVEYTSGEPEIDNILSDSFHYMLYQEAVMKIFTYLGIPMKDSYDTIKKISKKKLVGEQLRQVEETLKEHWLKNIGNLDHFEPVYRVVKDSASYSFNSNHALSMAFDSLYEAWFKAHYPAKFYEVVLNHYQEKNDKDKIFSILKEAKEFFGYHLAPFCYGQPHNRFRVDGDKNVIYPTLSSVKGIGEQAANDIESLSARHYQNLPDFLDGCKGTKINQSVIDKLVKIGFFSPFGNVHQIESSIQTYRYLMSSPAGRKKISKSQVEERGITREEILPYATDILSSGKQSEKQYTITDMHGLVRFLVGRIQEEEYPIVRLARYEYEVTGDVTLTDPDMDKRICLVMSLDTKHSPKFTGYCLKNGNRQELKIHKCKDNRSKEIKTSFSDAPVEDGDILILRSCRRQQKQKKEGDKWVPVPGVFEWWVNDYSVIR